MGATHALVWILEFYWKGSYKSREHGVRFAVMTSLLNMVEPDSNGSERLLNLRFISNMLLFADRNVIVRIYTGTRVHTNTLARRCA